MKTLAEQIEAVRARQQAEIATSEAVGAVLNNWLDFGLEMFSGLKKLQGSMRDTQAEMNLLLAALHDYPTE